MGEDSAGFGLGSFGEEAEGHKMQEEDLTEVRRLEEEKGGNSIYETDPLLFGEEVVSRVVEWKARAEEARMELLHEIEILKLSIGTKERDERLEREVWEEETECMQDIWSLKESQL